MEERGGLSSLSWKSLQNGVLFIKDHIYSLQSKHPFQQILFIYLFILTELRLNLYLKYGGEGKEKKEKEKKK